MDAIRAFTISDENYFLGTVGLLNSLRRTGHDLPLTVLDRGLAAWQLDLLEPHCEVRRRPSDRSPMLRKLDAPLATDADGVLLLDSDIIVAGSLAPLLGPMAQGRVVACADHAIDRWFPEWASLFALEAPLRHGAYLNSGAVAISRALRPGVLERWRELCDVVHLHKADDVGPRPRTDPLWTSDQEAMNALLLSEVPEEHVRRLTDTTMVLGDDLARTRLRDPRTLRCTHDGQPVTLLHAIGRVKPWQARARRELRPTAYASCLREVLARPGDGVHVPVSRVPLWLRRGPAGIAFTSTLHTYGRLAQASRPLRRAVGLSPGKRQGDVPG